MTRPPRRVFYAGSTDPGQTSTDIGIGYKEFTLYLVVAFVYSGCVWYVYNASLKAN
jgi:hypothetical protein